MSAEDSFPSSQLPSGAPAQRTTGGGVRWTPPSPEHMERMLPQYDQWQRLGQGGMGAVYQARQVSLDRPVAIKILPPEAADDEEQFIERFKNEARTMAKMNHPAIVGVYDFGETSEGQLYFVMEFVDGTDVAKMIQDQGRLPPEHAMAITASVCDALQYAHDRSVIHRDIKPANILLNRQGEVKVADFGLAKLNDPAAGLGLTRSGMAMGTPDFVAPEALMMGVTVDHRADLYAIGVMLYQMLTGKIPRGVFNPATKHVPGLDPRFDAIIKRAMAEDREERYSSAAEIRCDLAAILTTPYVERRPTAHVAAVPPPQVDVPGSEAPEHRPPPRAARPPAPTPPPRTGPNIITIVLGVVAVVAVAAFFLTKKPVAAPQGSSKASAAANTATAASSASAPVQSTSPAPETPPVSGAAVSGSALAPPAASILPQGQSRAMSQASNALDASPSSPGAAAPQGEWVDLFATGLISTTGLERLPDGGDGASSRYVVRSSTLQSLTTTVYKDCILRARFSGSWKAVPSLIVRYDPSRSSGHITCGCSNYSAYLRERLTGNAGKILTGEMAAPLLRDQTFELELKAVGDRFFFSRDGKTVVEGTVEGHPVGAVGFFVHQDTVIEGLELLPLGGFVSDAPTVAGVDGRVPTNAQSALPSLPADPRLAQLEAGFQARYATDAQKPYETALAALNKSYVTNGIARARAEAQARGSLPEVMALDAEKAVVERSGTVPPDDALNAPEGLKALRATYRTAVGKLDAERGRNAAPLYDMYLTALDGYVAELTRANKTTEALKVKSLRDEIAARKPKGTTPQDSESRSIAVKTGSSPANPANSPPGTYDVTLDWVPSGFSTGEGYRRQSTPLAKRKPSHVTKLPDGLSNHVHYATIPIGAVKDEVKVTVVLDEEAPDKSRLWVDANGNGDLTDDPVLSWNRIQYARDFFAWRGSMALRVSFGAQHRELGLQIYRLDKRENQRFADEISFSRDYGLAGQAAVAGKTFKMRVGDHTARGDFMNSPGGYYKIDLNGDGKFDSATEEFGFADVFEIDGTRYEVVGLKPGGNSFQIQKASRKGR